MSYTQKDLGPFVRGDDWALKLTITNNLNYSLDVSGYSYWLTLKVNVDDADPGALQITNLEVPTSSSSQTGIIILDIPAAQTATLDPISYYYDIQQKDTEGKIQTLLMGRIKVIKDVTNAT